MPRVAVTGWAVGLFAAAVGCGGGGPQFAGVEGVVTQNGKPLDNVTVEFHPDGAGPRSVATTDADGRYALKADDGKNAGAVVGSHKVVVRDTSVFPNRPISRDELNQDFAKGKKIRVPAAYGEPGKSPLAKTVAAGQTNQIDLEVK
jgi:hypothetical protein